VRDYAGVTPRKSRPDLLARLRRPETECVPGGRWSPRPEPVVTDPCSLPFLANSSDHSVLLQSADRSCDIRGDAWLSRARVTAIVTCEGLCTPYVALHVR
jgi:hypothetical protein